MTPPPTADESFPTPLDPALGAVVMKDDVDLRRPLVAQVGAMGATYETWVHKPISPQRAEKVSRHALPAYARSAKRWPKSLRMFESAFLESLSHPRWWHVLLVWVPILSALFLGSVGVWGSIGTLSWGVAALYALGGLFFWTIVEYVLHRFAFHYQPTSSLGRRLHFLAHGVHHLDPWDPTRLVFPPVAGIAVVAVIFGLVWIVLSLPATMAWIAGMLVGYLVYDMTHYYTHHGRPTSRWGKFLKAYHLAHHHKEWNAMYGVSSPLWDIVFRTTGTRGS